MSRSNLKAVRDLQCNELTIMTKSQEENVFKITIDNEDSDDELNNAVIYDSDDNEDSDYLLNDAVIYDSDDDMIKKLRRWDKLRRLNNLSPRLKKMFEIKQKIMDFENEFPELFV